MELVEHGKQVGSSTLNRALAVLEALAAGPPTGLTAAQLAEITGSNRVSVYRILATFQQQRFIRQERPGAPYRLGFRLLELGEQVIGELDIVPVSYPLLEELARSTGETCHLGVLDGSEAVYVAKVESKQSVRLVSHIGAHIPLYCTGLGKALLAATAEPLRDELVDAQSYRPRTANTRTSPDALRADLAEIRARGYALDDVENEDGVRCVAAAVLDHARAPAAAISVSGPTARVTPDRVAEIAELTVATAARLSAALGYGGDGASA